MPFIPESLEGQFFRKTIEMSSEPESLYWFRRADGVVFVVVESERHAGGNAIVLHDDGRPTGNTIAESLFSITAEMRALREGHYNAEPHTA